MMVIFPPTYLVYRMALKRDVKLDTDGVLNELISRSPGLSRNGVESVVRLLVWSVGN